MQTIETRYLPPTNRRPARVKATVSGGLKTSVTHSWHTELSDDEKHAAVAKALIEKLGWCVNGTSWLGGHTKRGMVWVSDDTFATPHFSVY